MEASCNTYCANCWQPELAVKRCAVAMDAIILSGGRSSRLDFRPKAEFLLDGSTLLERTVAAASRARRTVIVGPEPQRVLPDSVLRAREDPPFSGPVAAIAAGLIALARASEEASDATLVLACDMPHVSRAVPLLVQTWAELPHVDGVIAVDADDRLQPLAAVYSTPRLLSALEQRQRAGSLISLPMFRLIDGFQLEQVHVLDEGTADIDTWDDVARLGATEPVHSIPHERIFQ